VVSDDREWLRLIDRLLPFHVTVDAALRLVRIGPLLRRVAPGLREGEALTERFTIQPEPSQPTFETLRQELDNRLVILRLDEPFVQIRGGFVPDPHGDGLIFAGSLWVTELERLAQLGLAAGMLPPNDPLIDLLMTHRLMMTAQQSSQRAIAAARESQTLRRIETLEQENRRLAAELQRAAGSSGLPPGGGNL
jgi:hypothetical protein